MSSSSDYEDYYGSDDTRPAAGPPPGVEANINNKDLQPVTIGIHATFLGLMGIVLILRVYSRRWRGSRRLWWDDHLAFLAAVAILTYSGLELDLLQYGVGKHLWNVLLGDLDGPGSAISPYNQYANLTYQTNTRFPLVFAMVLIKVSAGLLYWRQFTSANKAFRAATALIIAACLVYYTLVLIFTANDFDTCGNATCFGPVFGWISYMVDKLTNLYLLILPIPVVIGLRTTRVQRVGIVVAFLLGTCALAASIACLVFWLILPGFAEPTLGDFGDITYTLAILDLPMILQLTLGIIAISIPALENLCPSSTPSHGPPNESAINLTRISEDGVARESHGPMKMEEGVEVPAYMRRMYAKGNLGESQPEQTS